jgi:hypothetical protein
MQPAFGVLCGVQLRFSSPYAPIPDSEELRQGPGAAGIGILINF